LLQVGLSFGWDISIHNIAIISAILLLFMWCISLHNLFANVWYVIIIFKKNCLIFYNQNAQIVVKMLNISAQWNPHTWLWPCSFQAT
jgi:hypothetical protein